jgi:signal transduction histidine kinase
MHANEMADANGRQSREQHVRPLRATFRNILLVVFLIFVFAVVQMFILWRVCNRGMKTAASLEHQGLPTLNALASLQEHLATYRLFSYEYLFAREEERAAREKAVETIAVQTRAEVENLKQLLPEGQGRQLAADLEEAIDDLDGEFRKVRSLVDSDFAAAMKAMDQNIPPKTGRVAAAAKALKDFGYGFSGSQASATFGSFGWIKNNAVMFGAGNILVAFGSVMFVQLAARRSREQLTETLGRLDERTQELAGSLSQVHATLEATADGIVLIDENGLVKNFNHQFLKMWGIGDTQELMNTRQGLLPFAQSLLAWPEALARMMEKLAAHPQSESLDLMELKDHRFFECCSKPQRLDGRICGRVWSFRDITEQKRMQHEVAESHKQLLQLSRHAGMAEVATNVLHNVGNVLNSVNISASLVADAVKQSRVTRLPKIAALLREHLPDLPAYLTIDPGGRELLPYLDQLAARLLEEQKAAIDELRSLQANIEHIKEIVAMQQGYAKVAGVNEFIHLRELVEDSLRMTEDGFRRHEIGVVRELEDVPLMQLDRHKVLQVLVNLIRNAKRACQDSSCKDRQMTVRLTKDNDRVKVSVTDNGIGIPAENLTRIFHHGFTTRKDGHGFGLHSGALAAKEMDGSLTVQSEGAGCGATFTLELPCPANDEPVKALPSQENLAAAGH